MVFGAELDLYDAGAKLVADLIVDQYPDLVELELDGNQTAFWPQCAFVAASYLHNVAPTHNAFSCSAICRVLQIIEFQMPVPSHSALLSEQALSCARCISMVSG